MADVGIEVVVEVVEAVPCDSGGGAPAGPTTGRIYPRLVP